MRVHCLVACALLLGAQHAAAREQAARDKGVYLARECSPAPRQPSPIARDEFAINVPPKGLCVEPAPRLDFKPGRLHLAGLPGDRGRLAFECTTPAQEAKLWSGPPERRVALVVAHRVLAVFQYNASDRQPPPACGQFFVGSWSDAMRACMAITAAWDVPDAACATACKPGDTGVCADVSPSAVRR